MTFKVRSDQKVKNKHFQTWGRKAATEKKTSKNTPEAHYQSKDYFNRKEIKILFSNNY